jgi:hypothetical protein
MHSSLVATAGRVLAVILLAAPLTACGSSAPPGSASASATPAGASDFTGFRSAYCSAWLSIFTAFGNPDTGSVSDLMATLDAAITAHDEAVITIAAAKVKAELDAGRSSAALAGAWPPGAEPARLLGILIASYDAMLTAKVGAASKGLTVANDLGQKAFIAAGAGEAWKAMFDPAGWAAVQSARPASAGHQQCPGVPVSV